ncbi:hypothetical protein DV515_00013524 [Chloebia gouldiae]|uniref:Phospholipase A2 domain-containing protein n=1 Tax=Chloebia gouldiae TaxID=44316 RepID=A0A3L8S129_CHLGU|nr:hypothetical protein DV515_00013524 [Chloebia gouldiae]
MGARGILEIPVGARGLDAEGGLFPGGQTDSEQDPWPRSEEDEGPAGADDAGCLQCVHSEWEAPTHVHTGTRGKHRRKPDCPWMLQGMGHLEGCSGSVQATLPPRANAGPGVTPGLCITPAVPPEALQNADRVLGSGRKESGFREARKVMQCSPLIPSRSRCCLLRACCYAKLAARRCRLGPVQPLSAPRAGIPTCSSGTRCQRGACRCERAARLCRAQLGRAQLRARCRGRAGRC